MMFVSFLKFRKNSRKITPPPPVFGSAVIKLHATVRQLLTGECATKCDELSTNRGTSSEEHECARTMENKNNKSLMNGYNNSSIKKKRIKRT